MPLSVHERSRALDAVDCEDIFVLNVSASRMYIVSVAVPPSLIVRAILVPSGDNATDNIS